MHILPDGFFKMRHYGLLCNRYRKENLKICPKLLGISIFLYTILLKDKSTNSYICPVCKKGHMHFSHCSAVMKC